MRLFPLVKTRHAFLALISCLVLTVSAHATDKQLPTPLDIETALSLAKEHPRAHLKLEQQLLFPRRQSLFLNCHDISYNNTDKIDNQRNRTVTQLVNPVVQQKLYILQTFFDVLLADSNLIGINEDMAGAYIAYDRAKTRQEYKQLSELVVAKLEAEYQEVRQQFFSGEAAQRLTRAQLANAINHPNELSSELNPPGLIKPPQKLPDVDTVYQQALHDNTWIKQINSDHNSDYERLIQMELRQEILELILRLKVLSAAQQRAETQSYRRDLDLEMSRSLYDMEVKASLGRSMTLQSKARMEEERIGYCQTLTWAKLNALRSLPLLTPPPHNKQEKEKSE